MLQQDGNNLVMAMEGGPHQGTPPRGVAAGGSGAVVKQSLDTVRVTKLAGLDQLSSCRMETKGWWVEWWRVRNKGVE